MLMQHVFNTAKSRHFDVVKFPFLDGAASRRASCGVYISQLSRFVRVCNHIADTMN